MAPVVRRNVSQVFLAVLFVIKVPVLITWYLLSIYDLHQLLQILHPSAVFEKTFSCCTMMISNTHIENTLPKNKFINQPKDLTLMQYQYAGAELRLIWAVGLWPAGLELDYRQCNSISYLAATSTDTVP